jgi:hypothetical protein
MMQSVIKHQLNFGLKLSATKRRTVGAGREMRINDLAEGSPTCCAVPGARSKDFGLSNRRSRSRCPSTPKDVVAKLNDAMVRVLNEPAVRARFTQLGLDMASPEQQRPEGLAALHKAEIEKWWPIIKSANIKAE